MENKITVQFTESITRSREIELPFYSMNNCHAYKVISETQAICVCYGLDYRYSIAILQADTALKEEESTPCKFNEKFNMVSRKLTELAGDNLTDDQMENTYPLSNIE